MIKQLSIFAENKKGAMQDITGLLADANINILALITNDSAEFGIVRMLVSDTEAASEILQSAGYLCRSSYVIAVDISDQPGALFSLLTSIRESNINIDYLYISYDRNACTPIALLQASGIAEVEECLISKGYSVRQ